MRQIGENVSNPNSYVKRQFAKKVYNESVKYRLIPILFGFFLTLPTQVFAFVVQGNSSSTNTSTTTIEGNGSVTTHIESTVNGNTKTFDSNTPGTYILENSSDDTDVHITPRETLTPSSFATPTAITKHDTENKLPHALAFVGKIQSFFHETIQKLLSLFHL